MADTVRIESIGAQGDGIAETPQGRVFVPFTVPGDLVRVSGGRLVEVLEPGPSRVGPACAHFGDCGGCDLQTWRADELLAWKRQRVVQTLAHRALTTDVAPVVATPAGERRRARLALTRDGEQVLLGFRARESHRIVNLDACPLLSPALAALVPALRTIAKGDAVFEITDTESGVDLILEQRNEPNAAMRSVLARFAAIHRVARVSWRSEDNEEPELAAQLATPVLRFGGVAVDLPSGAFVQASPTAEAALLAEVEVAAKGAKRVADLYAGCGAFALPLASLAAVQAVEGNAAAARALEQAARRANLRVTVENRDLSRRPLQGDELKKIDLVVLDPPRAGAKEQCDALARSKVATIAYVSCNPATFARDVRTLVDGGYRLERVVPVDQFLWSAHVELVAILRR